MASPRHLWSGDWASESASTAEEIARRREQPGPAPAGGGREQPGPVPAGGGRVDQPGPAPAGGGLGPSARQAAAVPKGPGRAPAATRRERPAAATGTVERVRPWGRRRLARVGALLVVALAVGGGVAFASGAFSGESPGASSVQPAFQQPHSGFQQPQTAFQQPQPWLGLMTTTSSGGTGALVTQVVPGGPGDQAGLRQGDVITAVNGEQVTGPADIASVVDPEPVGTEVLLQIDRGGQLQTVGVILAGRPTGGP